MGFRDEIKIDHIGILIQTILPIPFCFLTLFILVYYIRRRYKLYNEKRNISQELLHLESYQNHLKNLKIMGIINNFLIVILVLELIQNVSYSIRRLQWWVEFFDEENEKKFIFFFHVRFVIDIYLGAINLSLVPILSLLMNYLWWTYRRYEHKHLIFTWTVYILLRSLLSVLLNEYIIIRIGSFGLGQLIIASFYLFDFIQFVYYTRRFYLFLKSREQEIRLFYFDRKAYLNSRNLRIHFLIASILVGLTLFFFTVGTGIFKITALFNGQGWNVRFLLIDIIFMPSKVLSKILILLNYLYIFLVIVQRSLRNRKKLATINENIRPLINEYHEGIFGRNQSNYVDFNN